MGTTVEDLLAAMTLEERVSLLAGADWWHTPPVDRLGIPSLKMTDGPVGARGVRISGGPPSTCLPCGTALAATWDVDLVARVGEVLGAEARAKGAHVLLAPTVNIHRTPLAGRNFECFSEDPHLTARMAVAVIGGVQSHGVGACIKHFVCNDSEFERFTISSEVPERALREIYLRPFEVALAEARPWAVMGAYNRLGGTWCCEHRELLTTILRDEWGFDGLVVSDWYATHSTVEALDAGLDLEMPGPTSFRGTKLVDAGVDEAIVDRSARRVLDTLDRAGALDPSYEPGEEANADSPAVRAVARAAAASAIVLLRNEGGLLPLGAAALHRVAVVGPGADALNILGGGSAAVSPVHATSILEGLRAALPGVEVRHEPGCSIARYPALLDQRSVQAPNGEPGIELRVAVGTEVALADKEPVATTVARRSLFRGDDVPAGADWCAVATTRFTARTSGRHVFQASSGGRYRLLLDGDVVAEGSGGRADGGVDLAEGEEHELRAKVVIEGGAPMAGLELRCQPPIPDDAMDRAVAAAKDADVVVCVVGTDVDWETEGKDRKTLALPGQQVELIRAVAAANRRTVVVVNAGAPVEMGWVDAVPAVVQSWFLGQETGGAVADVLLGAVDASGRLPTTIPCCIEDTPSFGNYPGEFGVVHYGEGLLVGHRWYDARGIRPAFPFGHGLSYTSWSYGDPAATVGDDGRVTAQVTVTNVGDRSGNDVVQVYVHPLDATVHRPPKQLAGFAKVHADPDESRTVEIVLDRAAFEHWDPGARAWRRTGTAFDVLVGRSAADIVGATTVHVPE